jgi:hypothetical protein
MSERLLINVAGGRGPAAGWQWWCGAVARPEVTVVSSGLIVSTCFYVSDSRKHRAG